MFSRQPLLCAVLCATAALLATPPCLAQLAKEQVPTSYNWDAAIAAETDADIKVMLNVLKKYKIPGATIGVQLNPNSSYVPYKAPQAWINPQYWLMIGFGINYQSPLRVASVSKPMTAAVWMNYCSRSYGCLRDRLEDSFYDLWIANVGPLPTPKDDRVLQIKIKHLLLHTSGFDNGLIGFDPAFKGTSVTAQISGILKNTTLLADPGLTDSYSNFGFMILARLAQGLMKRTWIAMNKSLFPSNAPVPVFSASDSIAVSALIPGAAEPGTYYVQKPDGLFKASTMAGNGNIVSNVATLSWFATQYWIGGDTLTGKRFTTTGVLPGYTWVMDGSMPGTMAVLAQYTTPGKRVAGICVLVNTRVPGGGYLDEMNSAALALLQNKFKTY